jgi:hypothetical protein
VKDKNEDTHTQTEEEEGEEEEEEEREKGDWKMAYSETGRVYWWNVKTRESVWEKPF